jgi:WD40 repeat protein
MYFRWSIENHPLQVYASTLILSPAASPIKELFKKDKPKWILSKPIMEEDWSPCLQTLEGHGHDGSVGSVSFSPDGCRLASVSADYTIKLWDLATWRCLQKFQEHRDPVTSIAFSRNGIRLRRSVYRRLRATTGLLVWLLSRLIVDTWRRHLTITRPNCGT